MATRKLTKRFIDGLEATGERLTYWDAELPGFGLRVSPSGKKSYVVKYRAGQGRRAPQRWLTLGQHGALTLEQARALAKLRLGEVAADRDPQAERVLRRKEMTLADLWARYADEQLPLKKPGTRLGYQQLWESRLEPAFGTAPLTAIKRSEIDRAHKGWGDRPYTANRALALLSLLFGHAERWDLMNGQPNPCRKVTKFREVARERYLTADELQRLGHALDQGELVQDLTPFMAGAIRLLILTGARVSEILNAEWAWVDWQRGVLNLPDSKTGKKPVYLNGAARAELERLLAINTYLRSPFVVQGRTPNQPLSTLKKPWARVCERANLEGVRLHGLRHTHASIGVAAGLSLAQVGKLLGHAKASTTQRYAHLGGDDIRAASEMVGERLDQKKRGAG